VRIRIKICGITRTQDALAAARLGADAIGLVFVPGSPRSVDPSQAREICRSLPPFITRVGLVMNPAAADVSELLAQVPLDCLQFHGEERASFCAGFQRPWIKALGQDQHRSEVIDCYAQADAILLDTHAGKVPGGSGQAFDWSTIVPFERPMILAGGLTPDNVAGACRVARPAAVDVSSGVETQPGIKSDKLMAKFIEAVCNA